MKSRSNLWRAALAGLLAFAAACDDRNQPTPSEPAQSNQDAAWSNLSAHNIPERFQNFDQELLVHQREIPGFGGYWFDQDGILNVYLTDPAQRGRAQAVLARHLTAEGFTLGGGRTPDLVNIRVHRGRYTVQELHGWRYRIRTAFGQIPGLTGLDLNERTNRVRLSLMSPAVFDEAMAVVAALGVPVEALALEVRGPARLRTNLRDKHRPVDGGMGLIRFRPDWGGDYPLHTRREREIAQRSQPVGNRSGPLGGGVRDAAMLRA